jgi:signal transduction histidine kinase
VRVSARADAGLQTIRFSVADTGIGIAPENLQFVFEEFSQIESPLQRRVKGTGLGLPLCRKLAASLGGHVELASEPGKGSVFSAVLPLAYRPAPNDGARRAEPLITASSVKGAS